MPNKASLGCAPPRLLRTMADRCNRGAFIFNDEDTESAGEVIDVLRWAAKKAREDENILAIVFGVGAAWFAGGGSAGASAGPPYPVFDKAVAYWWRVTREVCSEASCSRPG